MKAFYRLLYYLSILLTSILAGFTLAGAFAGDASPDSFTLMPFIGLILPVLLLLMSSLRSIGRSAGDAGFSFLSSPYWETGDTRLVFSSLRFLTQLPNRILNLCL